MAPICKTEEEAANVKEGKSQSQSNARPKEDDSGAVGHGLRDLSKVATAIHVPVGRELLSNESLDESVLVVSKGALEVRGDITMTEKLDALPPKKVRIRVYINKAEKLAGDSIFDKLDPYCICKLGDFKRFQTPVLWNVGPNPKFDFNGVLTFANEETLELTVMDHDTYSADDLCGTGSIPTSELYDGWSGAVQLTRPKRGIFKGGEDSLEEPAGKVFIKVTWDYEKVSALTRTPKQKTWKDQELFFLGEEACWGHEHIMLQKLFMRTLEQAASGMPYSLELRNIRVLAAVQRGGNTMVSCWKASKQRFLEFVKHTGREKPFLQACRVSSLEKQNRIKNLVGRLVRKWEMEEETARLRKGMLEAAPVEEVVDPGRFRVAYRGYKAHISVRNALNLSGGGFFDKLDPYAIVRFRGSKQTPFRTSVLQDAGADPVWDCEGDMLYMGEVALEISVWDYDKWSADDLIGTGVVMVEQFCNGFEGMIPISLPGNKSKKTMKQMVIVIGIQWPTLEQNSLALGNTSNTLTSGLQR